MTLANVAMKWTSLETSSIVKSSQVENNKIVLKKRQLETSFDFDQSYSQNGNALIRKPRIS